MDNIPLYIFAGFLDSGKTSCIKETLYDGRFNEGEKTLIITFEEGDVEYDTKFLNFTNCVLEKFEKLEELTIDKMIELDKKHKPERVFMELNGMQDERPFFEKGFYEKWELVQVLTTIDASTFNLYVTNMKQFIFNHVYNADMVVLNRIDDQDRRYLRNNLKAINPRIEIIYEDKAGNVTNQIDEELFDTTKPIEVLDNDYGLWYMDAVDYPNKYDGCQISFNLKYIEPVVEYENVAIMGRKAMVCCAQDVSNISLTCVNIDCAKMNNDDFYHLEGKIKVIKNEENYDTCIMYVDKCEVVKGPEDEMVYFN